MKKVLIKSINKVLLFMDIIETITIENPLLYRSIAMNLEEEIVFSENNVPLELDKNALVLSNPFDIEINDSKLLKLLYKKMEKDANHYEKESKFLLKEATNFVNALSNELSVKLAISDEMDFQKVFSSLSVRFEDESTSYVERLINYLKTNLMFLNIKIVIIFGLNCVLTQEELILFVKEVSLLDIVILNIQAEVKDIKSSFIIDSDWCIL